MRKILVFCLFLVLFSGCVITGPPVYRGEIYQMQQELKTKALKYRFQKEKKMADVGYRLLKAIPDNRGSFPYLGVRFVKIDKYVKEMLNINKNYGIAVAYVITDSPADKSGIQAADIIKNINGYVVNREQDLKHALRYVRPNQKIKFQVERNGLIQAIDVVVTGVPLEVRFRMLDAEIVNAGASSNEVVVTYGLMRFIQTEDELAIILSHELAHIARGHIGKRAGTDLVSILLGIAAGYGAESISPGSGDIVMQGVGGAFSSLYSRDFEREADYFSIIYVHRAGLNIEAGIDVWERFAVEIPESMVSDFFSTHPTSTERLLRIKKTVRDIKEGRIKL
ncbi:MAG: M48 family metalloprotease [Candidatus Saelkia tenebricola]|nr:M48 family metalloprotease [Candidatus Saelkia tenebricola]